MRTTIDLPDELYRQVKARAALAGLTLKDLITRYVEQGLNQSDPAPPRRRSELPVIIAPRGRSIPALSRAEMEELLIAEDVARVRGRDDNY
jgi:hypothetical protein